MKLTIEFTLIVKINLTTPALLAHCSEYKYGSPAKSKFLQSIGFTELIGKRNSLRSVRLIVRPFTGFHFHGSTNQLTDGHGVLLPFGPPPIPCGNADALLEGVETRGKQGWPAAGPSLFQAPPPRTEGRGQGPVRAIAGPESQGRGRTQAVGSVQRYRVDRGRGEGGVGPARVQGLAITVDAREPRVPRPAPRPQVLHVLGGGVVVTGVQGQHGRLGLDDHGGRGVPPGGLARGQEDGAA